MNNYIILELLRDFQNAAQFNWFDGYSNDADGSWLPAVHRQIEQYADTTDEDGNAALQ